MKRLGIFVLLAALILGQSVWLAPGAGAFVQDVDTAQSSPENGDTENPTATPTSTNVPVETPTDVPVSTATSAPSNTPEPVDEEPVIVAEEPTSTPTYKNIQPGDTVRVDVSVLNVRSGNSTSTSIVAQVRFGQTFVVLDGPLAANGYNWIEIDRPGTTVDGWIAAEYVTLALSAATATSTTEPTATNTPTPSPTLTGSETATSTATNTATPTNTSVASATATATATYKNIKPGDTIEVDVPLLNVRSSASTSSGQISQVRDGQRFRVLEGPVRAGSFDWVKIDLTGSADGWVAAQYVTLAVSASPTATSTPSNTPTATATLTGSETATATATATQQISAGNYLPGNIIVITTGVNVRTGPGTGTGNSILKVARAGEQGTVLTGNTPGGAYTWAQVEFDDVTGWVAINYITHAGMATATPEPGAWLLSLTLDCFSSPERITLTNSASSSITIESIVTHYDAGPGEPWLLNHTLGGNQSRSYLTGAGASGAYALTTSYRLTDSAGTAEGVTIETSIGTVQRSCPAMSSGEKWVEVNLSTQYMTVWQGSTRITGTYVSTGRPGFTTPTGTFYTWLRYVSQNMSGCIRGECYYVPNVPHVQYFTYGGHAFHGAYWHNNFGSVMSHGCVNLPLPFAEWFYYWFPNGSRVVIHY